MQGCARDLLSRDRDETRDPCLRDRDEMFKIADETETRRCSLTLVERVSGASTSHQDVFRDVCMVKDIDNEENYPN